MDTKSLMQLYEKLIQGSSDQCSLINSRKLCSVKKNYTSSQLAKMRFSDQYLELLNNEKLLVFDQTIEALKYFYTSENSDVKPREMVSSKKFYEFLFEHLFSKNQKVMLEQMVQAEFSGKKKKEIRVQSEKKKDIKIGFKLEKEEEDEGGKSEKHVFFQLLESIIWDQEDEVEKKKVAQRKAKKPEKTQEDEKQFSMSKMMSMFM